MAFMEVGARRIVNSGMFSTFPQEGMGDADLIVGIVVTRLLMMRRGRSVIWGIC